jgi:2-isopropylmalate synthase
MTTRIDTTKIYPASRMVSTLTGLLVQRNKAIVGQNAFAHESGIHQDGMLKYRETYEIMDPAVVGIAKTELVLGKHSGRHAFRDRVRQLGYTLSDEQIEAAFVRFKALADKKKEVFDEDIEALVDEQLELTHGLWELAGLQVTAGSNTIPTATVTLKDSAGEKQQDASIGDGPVDAIYSAIQRLTGITVKLTDYRIRSVTKGKEAMGEAQVELEHSGKTIRGRGVSTDQPRTPRHPARGDLRIATVAARHPKVVRRASRASRRRREVLRTWSRGGPRPNPVDQAVVAAAVPHSGQRSGLPRRSYPHFAQTPAGLGR